MATVTALALGHLGPQIHRGEADGHGLEFAVAAALAADRTTAALGTEQLRVEHVQMEPQELSLVFGLHHFIPFFDAKDLGQDTVTHTPNGLPENHARLKLPG